MANIVFKRGQSSELDSTPLKDGLLSFTTDDGRMHIDYKNENGEVVRKTLYGGKLKIGPYEYNGTKDVNVDIYNGNVD